MNPDLCAKCVMHVHCLANGPVAILKCGKCGLTYYGKLVLTDKVIGNLDAMPTLDPCHLLHTYPPDLPCCAEQEKLAQQIAKLRAIWLCPGCQVIQIAGAFAEGLTVQIPNAIDKIDISFPIKLISSPYIAPNKIYALDPKSFMSFDIKLV